MAWEHMVAVSDRFALPDNITPMVQPSLQPGALVDEQVNTVTVEGIQEDSGASARPPMTEGWVAGDSAEGGRIFIVRHAQSTANAGGVTADPATIPITDTGSGQAQSVADVISDRPHIVAASRYLRTVQTAEPLLRRYLGVPVEQWRVEEFTYLDSAACAGTTYVGAKAFGTLIGRGATPAGLTALTASALPILSSGFVNSNGL